ncbi:hypothetical protein STBA_02450 [Streptomyces sp. MP131-18]|nr:hypothetical protein STBA_02450 [Streptomyces sp. MP131-18]
MLHMPALLDWREDLRAMARSSARERAPMSEEELRALPPAIDLKTVNRALALTRSTGYDLARRGEYPAGP